MELGQQRTGHVNYFIYPSLPGIKTKKSSPEAFYCSYLHIYNTSFTGRSELLCWPKKRFIFKQKSSVFSRIVTYAKKVTFKLRIQIKNSIIRKCLNRLLVLRIQTLITCLSKGPQITTAHRIPRMKRQFSSTHFHAQNVIYSISHNAHTYLLRRLLWYFPALSCLFINLPSQFLFCSCWVWIWRILDF